MRMKVSLKERLLKKDLLLMSGATGTELIKRGGVMPGGINNLRHPETVAAIQREYQKAGAELFLTNTFSMNRLYCKGHLPDSDYREINRRGLEIALAAARAEDYVCGNIGPVGELLQPFGAVREEDVYDAFQEQARLLSSGAIDGFSIQTFYHLAELVLAVKAVRSVSDLPILASLVLTPTGATMMGDTLDAAYEQLNPLGVEALGHNCGEIEAELLGVLFDGFTQRGAIALISCLNAGQPRLRGTETVYDMEPAAFAEGALLMRGKGATVIGGCCGTTPAHIDAMCRALRS